MKVTMTDLAHKPLQRVEKQMNLPSETEAWPLKKKYFKTPDENQDDASYTEIKKYCKGLIWNWPEKRIVFICDVHADENALYNCLIAADLIAETKSEKKEIALTPLSKKSIVIFGGDYFDKGPLNLPLIDAIKKLKDAGLNIILLAGNHDIRTYTGLYYSECKETLVAHLFTRMGKKTTPLLKEVWDKYLTKTHKKNLLTKDEVKAKLFPPESWYKDFLHQAEPYILKNKITSEINRIKQKTVEISQKLHELNMDFGQFYAACQKAKEIFLSPNGEYAWLFSDMKLIHKEGPFVFVHAGFDDRSAFMLNYGGIDMLNAEFKKLLSQDPFDLYHGFLGNMFRTKYRDFDSPLSQKGTTALKESGVLAIVHGHKNILRGHRILSKKGLLHFECDVSVDQNTRLLENLQGEGGGALVIEPNGEVTAKSTDYPKQKVFRPEEFGSLVITSGVSLPPLT